MNLSNITILSLTSLTFASYYGGYESERSDSDISFLDACGRDQARVVMKYLTDGKVSARFDPGSEAEQCLMTAAESKSCEVIESIFMNFKDSHKLACPILDKCIRRHNLAATQKILSCPTLRFKDCQIYHAVEVAIEAGHLEMFNIVADHPAIKEKVYKSGQGLDSAVRLLRVDIVKHILGNLTPIHNTWYYLNMANEEAMLNYSKANEIKKALESFQSV